MQQEGLQLLVIRRGNYDFCIFCPLVKDTIHVKATDLNSTLSTQLYDINGCLREASAFLSKQITLSTKK